MDSSPANKTYKRHARNFLLDARFQLKYTGMVVAVTVLVASVLGSMAYDYSTGQTEALAASIAAQPELDPEVVKDLGAFAAEQDCKVLTAIVGGILALAIALGLTGIVVTHRVVGPAYRMQKLFDDLGKGNLKPVGSIRKNDELQDLYESFATMVEQLRAKHEGEAASLEVALNELKAGGSSDAAVAKLQSTLDAMRKQLG